MDTASTSEPADRAEIPRWIRSAAIPLTTAAPRNGYADLAPLSAIIGNARIASLGDATHGTHEFFTLKHRLLEFCVAELGFTMLGIEMPFAESLAVNAYVLGGAGTAADALAATRYWVWDTAEVLDLIEWMRSWNASHARKVKFYGFVVASESTATQGLVDFLVRVAPELAAECARELAPLASDLTAQSFGQLSEVSRDTAFACIDRVLTAFAQRQAEWSAATSALDWHLARLHARNLRDGARLITAPGSIFHDRVMAENVCALLEAEGPDAKAVLWAHNAHVSRSADPGGDHSMGQHLDDMVGRAQIVIGTSFDRGAFQARDYPSGMLADHRVPAAPPESFDGMLARAGMPLFWLDLANAPRDGAAGAWLASDITMRSIGGIFGLGKDNKYGATYTQTIVPRRHFDAIVFVADTTPTRGNRPRGQAPPAPILASPANLALAGDGVPDGWCSVPVDRKHLHTIGVSDDPSPAGGRAITIARAAPWRWGDGRLVQKIAAEAWRGKRIRFAAAIQTAVADVGAGALLIVTFLGEPQAGDATNFYTPAIAVAACAEAPVRAPQWTRLTVEAVVPDEACSLVFGLVLCGNGTASFGDLAVTTVEPPA